MEISRLSVSQITTNNWSFEEAVRNYALHGISKIGIWVDKIAHLKPSEVNKILKEEGLKATNLCFAGLFTGESKEKRDAAVDETKRRLELAAEIEAGFLLIVSGPTLPRRLEDARAQVRKAFEDLVPYAEGLGAKMALEAIHPIDISRWSVVVTVGQVLSIVRGFSSPCLGILLDLYNSWWEPGLEDMIEGMGEGLFGVHLADWNLETLAVDRRLLPGRGVIPLERLIRKVEASGYDRYYDIEIFNEDIWSGNYAEILEEIVSWFNKLEVR